MEEIEFEAMEGDGLLKCVTIFNGPVIMYKGDELIMEYDNFKVISVFIRRKNSS